MIREKEGTWLGSHMILHHRAYSGLEWSGRIKKSLEIEWCQGIC